MPLPLEFDFYFDKYQDWLPGWAYRRKITLDCSLIDGDLYHFPVLVHLSDSCGQDGQDLTHIFDELGSNSLKLAITKWDGLTELYVEVEKWDEVNEEAWLWVSRDGWWIDSIVDTIFYLYYDKDHSDNTTYVGIPNDVVAENVWDANFVLVDHMQDDPDTSHTRDSTDYDNDGTKKGANEPIEALGKVGDGQDFDGNDYITVTDVASLDITGEITLEALVTCSNAAGAQEIICKAGDGVSIPYILEANTGRLKFYFYDGAWHGTADHAFFKDADVCNYLAATYDEINCRYYVQGVAGDVVNINVALPINTGDLLLGAYFWPAAYGNYITGSIDEVRISDTVRSASWIKATYHTCWDNLLTYSDLEEGLPGCIVLIDGDWVPIKKGSISVDLNLGERNVAEFVILGLDGSETYQQGQPVEIYDTSMALIFSGVIDDPQPQPSKSSGQLEHYITCKDNHYYVDKRICAVSYLATSAENIVANLRLVYLDDEGITDGIIDAPLVITECILNYVYISDALDALAEKANCVWYIDETKQLHFYPFDTWTADWDATGVDIDKPYLSGKNPKYRNVQYIRGPTDITTEQTENHTGDNVMVAFPLGFPVAKEPTSIKEGGVGKTLGIKGVDAAKDWYWSKGDNNVYAAVPPGLGVAIEVKYYGEWNIIVLSEDDAAIAAQQAVEGSGSGRVEDVAFERGLTSKEAAFESAAAKLLMYCTTSRRFHYQTTRRKLKPGQLQAITYAPLGLSASDMLIESVGIRPYGRLVNYKITAIEGPVVGSWSNLFKNLATKVNMVDLLCVGEESTIIILVQPNEAWTWGEADVETVFACPVVGVGLFPGVGVFPC